MLKRASFQSSQFAVLSSLPHLTYSDTARKLSQYSFERKKWCNQGTLHMVLFHSIKGAYLWPQISLMVLFLRKNTPSYIYIYIYMYVCIYIYICIYHVSIHYMLKCMSCHEDIDKLVVTRRAHFLFLYKKV